MKFIGSKTHTLLTYLPHMLAFASFGILLGGIAASQNECGKGLDNVFFGQVDYLGPVSCDKLYSFDWFITFFQFFVWLLLLPAIAANQVHRARNMSTGLLMVASILLIHMTNVWYRAWSGVGDAVILTNTYSTRAKATFSGALIGAVADLFMIIFIGLHNEKASIVEERKGGEQSQFQTSYVATGAMPGATPVHVATTQAETIGYREGPVATEPAATAEPATTI
jgi:hypothetical protein